MEIFKNPSETPSATQKVIIIIIGSLIFAFGWRVRGDNGDPMMPMLMFLLFIGILFVSHEKFNPIICGLIIIAIRVMRRGWGTFVGQTTGKLEGYDYIMGQPRTEDNYIFYSVNVPPWQGFFWLFIVGIAWATLLSILIAYQFSEQKYSINDAIICIILFILGFIIGLFLAITLIPIIAPEAYYEVYIKLQLDRNYISMRDNLAFAFAIIPVLFYILIKKRDYYLVKIALIIMIIFGFALAIADLWQLYGRLHPELGLPFWELWEYYSGLIIGGLLILLFLLIPEKRWESSNISFNYYPPETRMEKVFLYILGHLILFIYPLAEHISASLNKSLEGMEINFSTTYYVFGILIILDLLLYSLYQNDKLGKKLKNFRNKDFSEKCLWI
ncbi:MAG: hypothetical protein ACTSQG_03400, partial [Promethearchaeota archaeon]